MQKDKPGWQKIPSGGVITEAGNAEKYRTGGWRVKKPLWSKQKCIQCMLCWIYCPDLAIEVEDKQVTGVDYYHCKGCGICANQCPADALEMIAEDEADRQDKQEIEAAEGEEE